MLRPLVFSLFLVVVAALAEARPAFAGAISPQNPYKSFNISGVNYGSMEWERTHRGQSNAVRPAPTARSSAPATSSRRSVRRR